MVVNKTNSPAAVNIVPVDDRKLMGTISSICVYCGSRFGNEQDFRKLALELGAELARRKLRLIYGGGHVGLMGQVADAALNAGGEVIGIIPQFLHDWEVGHQDLTELHVVPDMHSRKKMMFDLSDAFVALPGGLGTLDETIEIMTWRQLRQHAKPIVAVGHNNYWRPFADLLEQIVAQGFADRDVFELIHFAPNLEEMFAHLDKVPATDVPAHSDRL